jgi:hypothetical protein
VLELLTNCYLPDGTITRPYVWIPVKNGKVTNWEKIYPYDDSVEGVMLSGELDPFEVQKPIQDKAVIITDSLAQNIDDAVSTLGDKQISESEL